MMIRRTNALKLKSDVTGTDVNARNPLPDTRVANSSHGPVVHLQRTLGNQAVQRLFNPGVTQAKPKVGQPDDLHEQEASRIADEVMRMPCLTVQPKALNTTSSIRRRGDEGGMYQVSPLNRITADAGFDTVRRVVWDPVKTVNENKRPFPGRWDIVGTDSLNPADITIWKPRKGDTYWCHGYTFGGRDASGGPYSAYGKDVPIILSQDGWSAVPSCHARESENDILVFFDYSHTKVQHTGIVRHVELKLESERFCNDPMLRLVIDNLLTLRKGLRGTQINQAVKEVQEALLDLGYRLPVYGADGLFGEETENAVCDYQMDKGLSFDGKIGPETLGSLDSEPQFLKSGLIDEEKSTLESKWGLMPMNTRSWLRNAGYGKYTCYSQHPVMEPPGAKGDFEF